MPTDDEFKAPGLQIQRVLVQSLACACLSNKDRAALSHILAVFLRPFESS